MLRDKRPKADQWRQLCRGRGGAHVQPVQASGPDIVGNGLALSGTAHWMFHHELISLSNDLDVLISRNANDPDGERSSVRFPTSYAGIASTASSNEADCIVTLRLHQARNIPADAPRFRQREMSPLHAISPDGDQHVELCLEVSQRGGVRCKKTRDQMLFIGGSRRPFLPCDGVAGWRSWRPPMRPH